MKLVPIDSIQPSTYNPRKADADRLDLVALSLDRLGFLLPIFATPAGEIISGHQRHHVAALMGVKQVPVELITKALSLDDRKALNVVFNRATNDLDRDDTSETVTRELALANVRAMAEALPSIPPDTEAFYPCLRPVNKAIRPLLKINYGAWMQYARNVSRTLQLRGGTMPIVTDPDGRVVNGIGRLQLAAEQKEQFVPVVEVPHAAAEFARAVLNYLSMDFNIHERYADVLRYNSFRRAVSNRPGLGKGFYVAHFGNTTTKTFDIHRPDISAKWRTKYGTAVLDFGAGHFTDTEILRSIRVDVTPFEPYPLIGSEIDIAKSRHGARQFLETVASGKAWKTIFISSVFNSIPFMGDRDKVATICSALCRDETRVHIWTMSTKQANLKAIDSDGLNQKMALGIQFKLNYEPNTIIGSFGSKPKVQKFHTGGELQTLLANSFRDVQIRHIHDSFICVCSGAVIQPQRLAEALAFEFDLPYPDGTRMGLVQEAKAAFSKRLGITIS